MSAPRAAFSRADGWTLHETAEALDAAAAQEITEGTRAEILRCGAEVARELAALGADASFQLWLAAAVESATGEDA
jgi:hypothetical protein